MSGKRPFWSELLKLWPEGGGEPEVWKGTSGAGHVRPIPGTGASSKNRFIEPDAVYAEGTNSATWVEADNVTEIYVTFFADAGVTAGAEVANYAWVVFDATDATDATTKLGQAASRTSNSSIHPIPWNTRVGPFVGTSYFTRIDFDTTANGKAFIEAQ